MTKGYPRKIRPRKRFLICQIVIPQTIPATKRLATTNFDQTCGPWCSSQITSSAHARADVAERAIYAQLDTTAPRRGNGAPHCASGRAVP
jgi:hypothetical protein